MTMAPKVCPRCGARYDGAASFCQVDAQALVTEDAPDPYIGELLFGQFRIDEMIGAGGMGTVYRARQLPLDRDVAVKILHRELVQNPDAVRRFHREARVTTSLSHPNLVHVYLFGQLPDGNLYLVMEYLKGESLIDVLRREGTLAMPRALGIAVQLCDGIGEAHAHGVVHRDVKPENVILLAQNGPAEFVKVLDFGIARFMWGEQTLVTQSGLIFGTARYISPEGAAGEPTDARSDVYSIGTLLYQMCSGETPFDSPSLVAILMKHMNEPPPDIRGRPYGIHVPAMVADVIMQCLAKNPEARPEDARALGSALRHAAQMAGIYVPPPLGGSPTRSGSFPPPQSTSTAGRRFDVPSAGFSPLTTSAEIPGLSAPRMGAFMTILLAFALGAAAVTLGAFFMGSLMRPNAATQEATTTQRDASTTPTGSETDHPSIPSSVAFTAMLRTEPAEPRAGQPITVVAELSPADAVPANTRVQLRVEQPDGATLPPIDMRRDDRQGSYIARTTLPRAGNFRLVIAAETGSAAPVQRDLRLAVRGEARRRTPVVSVNTDPPGEENHDIVPLAPVTPPSPPVTPPSPSPQDGINWQLPEPTPEPAPEPTPSPTPTPAPDPPPSSDPPAPWTQGDSWM